MSNQEIIKLLTDTLVDCEDYFDQRADADTDQDGYVPNDEMRLLVAIREALSKANSRGGA